MSLILLLLPNIHVFQPTVFFSVRCYTVIANSCTIGLDTLPYNPRITNPNLSSSFSHFTPGLACKCKIKWTVQTRLYKTKIGLIYVNSVCIGNDSIADLVKKKQLIEHGIALYCKIYMYVIYDTLYEFMILIQTPAMYMCLMYTFEDKCKHGQIYLKLYQSEKICFE